MSEASDAFTAWMRRVEQALERAASQQSLKMLDRELSTRCDSISEGTRLLVGDLQTRIDALEADKDKLKPFDVAQRERIDVAERRLEALEAKQKLSEAVERLAAIKPSETTRYEINAPWGHMTIVVPKHITLTMVQEWCAGRVKP